MAEEWEGSCHPSATAAVLHVWFASLRLLLLPSSVCRLVFFHLRVPLPSR